MSENAKRNTSPVSIPAFKVVEAEVPAKAVTRSSEPNPFSEVFDGLAEGKARAIALPKPSAESDVARLVSKVKRQLQDAAPEDKTVRTSVEISAKSIGVTFWLVAKITRPRKPAAE